MKILYVTPYLPAPPDFGGARRVYELIRQAGQRHDTVTLSLAAPDDDPRAAEYELGRVVPIRSTSTARMPPDRQKRLLQLRSLVSTDSFQRRFYYNADLQRAIDRIISTEQIDIVQFEFSQMGVYSVPYGVPTVLDIHNIEHHVLRQIARSSSGTRRLFNELEYRKFQREEQRYWQQATHCLTTSKVDADRVRQTTNNPVTVIPNGVDLSQFPLTPLASTDTLNLVFTGAMRYLPNAEGARFFIEDVLPLVRQRFPEARVSIVGADPPPELSALRQRPGVEITGTVDDIRPWIAGAGAVVVPLLSGGGTRLKILEAFASGRPVVSTTIGAAGLEIEHDRHLLLADTAAGFASALERLATEPGLRERLAEAAYALVRDRYQWTEIYQVLDGVYERLASA